MEELYEYNKDIMLEFWYTLYCCRVHRDLMDSLVSQETKAHREDKAHLEEKETWG